MFDVQQRTYPEQLVLTEQRNLRQRSWPAGKTAQEYGGVVFVVYHGQVTEESDGTVESARDHVSRQEGSTAAAMRRKLAHREAYVRLTKAQSNSRRSNRRMPRRTVDPLARAGDRRLPA